MAAMASHETRLLSAFVCPSCRAYVRPPMRQCESGHSLCESCFESPGTCPVCGSHKTSSRCFAMENIFAKLMVPCKNHIESCHFIDRGHKIQNHEAICPYRSLPCPMCTVEPCNWVGSLKTMTNHFKTRHPMNFYKSNRQTMIYRYFVKHDETESALRCAMFKAYGELFKFGFEVNYFTGIIKMCVYHLGHQEATHRYSYGIDIKNPNSAEELTISAPCQHLDGEEEMLTDPDRCSIMHYNVLKRCTDCHDLTYQVQIFNSGEF